MSTVHAGILGVHLVRRHLLAVALWIAVLAAAQSPLPAVLDAVTGSPAGNANLVNPALYLLLAPLSNILDALTFLSIDRAKALLVTWLVVLALVGVVRSGTARRRLARVLGGVVFLLLLAVAAVLLPRPVPRLATEQSDMAVVDFHSHTIASHDGRLGWTLEKLAKWHAIQGFQTAYVTDHNRAFPGSRTEVIPLLPGAEWSVYRQHVVALGATPQLDLAPYSGDTPGMLMLFAALHAQGALAIASLPEYWRNHRDELDQFVAAGVDGFEIVNCSPKGLAFPAAARHTVIDLAQRHDKFVTGASDNHGWGKVTCVWNLTRQGTHGFADNRVVARPLALLQADGDPTWAGLTQPWLMLRALSWPERISWLTWITLIAAYRGLPRRNGQRRGLGFLARSLGRRPAQAGKRELS